MRLEAQFRMGVDIAADTRQVRVIGAHSIQRSVGGSSVRHGGSLLGELVHASQSKDRWLEQ
jgi:hypothetical protein